MAERAPAGYRGRKQSESSVKFKVFRKQRARCGVICVNQMPLEPLLARRV